MIAAIGELLVEFICTEVGGRHLRPAPYRGPFPSGAPGIFIDQAARVGGRAIFAGNVGDDAFGEVLLRRLEASGVDLRLVARVPMPTGTAHVSYNRDGSRDFVFNIARSAAGRLPEAAVVAEGFSDAGVRLLHVSGSSLGDPGMRRLILQVAQGLAGQGVLISIDPNIRPELMRDEGYLAAVRDLIAMAAYVLPSDADVAHLWPVQEFADWAGALIARGARAVVLKRGAEGCLGLAPGDGPISLPAHEVEVVDPTGAGDCFCATFVALHLDGMALGPALARANAAGALAVSRLGPMEGNATRAEIETFLG